MSMIGTYEYGRLSPLDSYSEYTFIIQSLIALLGTDNGTTTAVGPSPFNFGTPGRSTRSNASGMYTSQEARINCTSDAPCLNLAKRETSRHLPFASFNSGCVTTSPKLAANWSKLSTP